MNPAAPSTAVRLVELRLEKQVSALGLGVFRVAYGCVLFLEIAQLFYFRHFFFDRIPYVSPGSAFPPVVLSLWLLAAACLTVGFFTRTAAIASYAFTLLTLSRFTTFEYHHDYILIGVNFLLMFLPVGRRLSIDRLLERRRATTRGSSQHLPTTVSVLAYELPVFVGIALVYADSAVYKVSSSMWMAGLGLWQPASAPYATLLDWSRLLDQRVLVTAAGFLVVAFESVFIFLMWSRKARVPLFIFGTVFHLGIFLIFALPLFALGVASLFLLVAPAGLWERIATRLGASPPAAPGFGSSTTRSAETSRRWAVAITAFVALVVATQLACLLESPPLVRRSESMRQTALYRMWRSSARMLLGLHPHAVFMGIRYAPYRSQFAVVYVGDNDSEIWLPVVSKLGHASYYSTGRQQVYWMHRVNGSELRPERMEDGIRRLTAFWAHQSGLDLDDTSFRIMVRHLWQPDGWEKGLLHRQYEQPWAPAGSARWLSGSFELDLADLDVGGNVFGP